MAIPAPRKKLEAYSQCRVVPFHAIGIPTMPRATPSVNSHFGLHRSTRTPWNGTSSTRGSENEASRIDIWAWFAW